MRAIVFSEKNQAEVWSNLKPQTLKDDEVQLQTLYTSISVGTERHILTGGPFSEGFPTISGYQNVGRIVKVGSGVKGWNVGDIIFSDFGSTPDGWKYSCWGGHIEIRNKKPEGNFIKLPPKLDIQEATLLGVMSIGMKAAKRGNVQLSDRVLVVGLGLIGQACAQSSNAMGAEVHGIDLLPLRTALAEKTSCHKVWNGRKKDVWDKIRQTGPFDVIFDTSGAERIPDLALSCIRRSTGRMVAVAGKHIMTYKNIESGMDHESTIIHTSHFNMNDMRDVIRQVLNKRMFIGPIITHRVKVAKATEIYNKIVEDPSDLLGVVFDWL